VVYALYVVQEMRILRWLATITLAIGTPIAFTFLLAALFGAFRNPQPSTPVWEGESTPTYFGGILLFTSVAIWCAAPSILKDKKVGAWLRYGLLSPIFGGIFVAILSIPTLLVHFHIFALIILGLFMVICIPVGILVGFLNFLIWRLPKDEDAEQAVDGNPH